MKKKFKIIIKKGATKSNPKPMITPKKRGKYA